MHKVIEGGLRPGGQAAQSKARRLGEVFRAFLKLGLISFGGPVAHLGYFREEFVRRRRWLDDAAYGDLVTLCQFLPGPASSQVVFALGVQQAGLIGGMVASLCRGVRQFLSCGVASVWRGPRGAAMAAVVGVLLAALYNPVWTGGVKGAGDVAAVMVAYGLLQWWKAPPWLVVLLTAGAAEWLL